MAESLIKWKRGDYVKLGKAVSDFNKKRNRLINEENELYFPDEIEYMQAKKNITTRRELNRYINMLKRFQEDDATDLYVNQAGEEMTKWTRRELGRLAKTVKQRATRELKKLNTPKPGEQYSLAQMGHGDVKIQEWRIRKAEQIEMKKGYEFKQLQNFINFQGASDLYTKRAITFQKNYMEVLQRYENYDSYPLLLEVLNKIKNPNQFYEVFKNTENELDLELSRQSDEVLVQAQFNAFVERIANAAKIQIDLAEFDTQEEVINL